MKHSESLGDCGGFSFKKGGGGVKQHSVQIQYAFFVSIFTLFEI
ncbi:hypothetical protein [uncultured Helicobacter sp.]